MINNHERINRIDTSNEVGTYHSCDIGPTSLISKDIAQDFWDALFGRTNPESEIDQDGIESEIYGREEDEFSFDINVNDEGVCNVLIGFQNENWGGLSEIERMQMIEDFEIILCNLLSITRMPEIQLYEGPSDDCGSYDPTDNSIWINSNNFDDPQETVDTLAHEMRHAFQYERASKLETHEDRLYAYNFEHYIDPVTDKGFVNFLDYEDQLVEAEARAFASLFVI